MKIKIKKITIEILKTLSKNKYFLFFKIKFNYIIKKFIGQSE